MGSTAMRSLFRTHSRVRHFLSFLQISRLPESSRVCIKTKLLLTPSRPMNQLVQLHLRLLPRWTTCGKATTMDSSAGKVSFFALEFSTNKAFLLHSSHKKIHRHFILRSRIFYWYIYTLTRHFFFFALEQASDSCLCGRSSALIPKEIFLVTINEESHMKENHDFLNWIHVVTLWCDYTAVKPFRDWLHLFSHDGWILAAFLSRTFSWSQRR